MTGELIYAMKANITLISPDDWIDDELAKTTAFDDTTLAKGTDLVDDDEVPEDWEDQMKAMSMLP